jgi:hypothetical protein
MKRGPKTTRNLRAVAPVAPTLATYPKPPPGMSAPVGKKWAYYADLLLEMKTLSIADGPLLQRLAEASLEVAELDRLLKKFGYTTKKPSGTLALAPIYLARKDALAREAELFALLSAAREPLTATAESITESYLDK